MILKQYYLGCLAHASYLLGDEESKTGIVVDPQRDIDQYLKDASELGLEIRHVFLTHFHADFLAGHLELRDHTGATIHLGAKAKAEYAFEAAPDGAVLTFGQMRLEILETPGHTPEAVSIVVYDLAKQQTKPHAVLTGDTLFIGDVGRPDLMASVGVTAEELGGMLYDSIHQKLLPLPDETLVYPAHGAGSMCGKNLSSETVSTMGVQRLYNYALQPMTKAEFIRLVTADQPEAPQYFAFDAMLNRKERPVLEASMARALLPLNLDEVLRQTNAGAQVLDVREPGEFAAAHLVGSVNIGLSGKFATWAGTLLSRDRPIVLIAEPGREEEAAVRLGRIGFDHVAGTLAGGMEALRDRPELLGRTERLSPLMLEEQLRGPEPPLVVDVRGPQEWEGKRIEGSLNLPLNHLEERLAEVPKDRRLALQCASGYRSSIAASLLKRHGIDNLADLAGGIGAWSSAKLPTVPEGAVAPACSVKT